VSVCVCGCVMKRTLRPSAKYSVGLSLFALVATTGFLLPIKEKAKKKRKRKKET